MSEQVNGNARFDLEVFGKIEEETRTYLDGEKLKVALNLLAYLKESGRTWALSEYHPEFFYMGELTCLFAFMKSKLDDASQEAMRRKIEGAGNRYAYDPSSTWTLCCWQHEDDIYEPDNFAVGEDVKEYARENVWKCIRCHADGSCGTLGGSRRIVFGKEYGNACCNVFQLINPDEKELECIIKLMELEKHIIARRKDR
jgi:hypothetical protein